MTTGRLRGVSTSSSSLANVAWDPNGLLYSYDEYKQKYARP